MVKRLCDLVNHSSGERRVGAMETVDGKDVLEELGQRRIHLRMAQFSGREVGGSWWRSDDDYYS